MFSKRNILYFLILFLLYVLGVTQYIADSEFWPITLAHEFGNFTSDNTSLYYKFLFHGILKIPYYFSLSNVEHIILVKLLMSAVGIGILILFYKLNYKIYKSQKVALWSSALLLTMQTFFSQYSRVRSDLLVCFLILLSFWHILKVHDRKSITVKDLCLQSALLMAAFFCTPKAIYWIVLSGVFLYLHLTFIKKGRRLFLVASLFSVPFSLLIIGGLQLGIPILERLDQAWVASLMYFRTAQLTNWVEFGRLLTFDAFGSFCVLASLGLIIYETSKKKSMTTSQQACFWVSISAIVFLMLHTQRVAFFIGALMPFIFLPVGYLVQFILKLKLKKQILAGVFVIFIGSKLFSFSTPHLYWHSSLAQIEKIAEIETVLKTADDPLIFDGMGILPRFRNVYIYLEPVQQTDPQEIVDLIRERNPDVILWNNRSYILYPYLASYLDSDFTEVSPGFWGKKEKTFIKMVSSVPIKYYFLYEPSN